MKNKENTPPKTSCSLLLVVGSAVEFEIRRRNSLVRLKCVRYVAFITTGRRPGCVAVTGAKEIAHNMAVYSLA